MSKYAIALILAAGLSVSACDTKALQNAADVVNATTPAAAGKTKVNGKVFASADQVAVISTGGLNLRVLARSDEKGVAKATVKLTELGGSASATAQTNDTGSFTVEVPSGKTYAVSVTFTAKDDATVTLSGLTVVGTTATNLELDVAHNLVASKLLALGAKKVDAAKLTDAVSQMSTALQAVSKAPTPKTQTEAAAAFDANATEALKTAVTEMAK